MTDNKTPESGGISRRTVAKAMAWAVPAIAIAAPAPAFAASGSTPVVTPGPACKIPGATNSNKCPGFNDKSYLFPFRIQNPDPTKTIYILSVSISTTPSVGVGFSVSQPALPAQISPGQTIDILFGTNSNSSANVSFTASITITWGHTTSDTDHAPITSTVIVGGTPPECPCFKPSAL